MARANAPASRAFACIAANARPIANAAAKPNPPKNDLSPNRDT